MNDMLQTNAGHNIKLNTKTNGLGSSSNKVTNLRNKGRRIKSTYLITINLQNIFTTQFKKDL